MARLVKAKLIAAAVTALRAAGWVVTPMSAPGVHPARFTLARRGESQTVRLYIWNLTHGGGKRRPKGEYRIQVTSGVRNFEPEPDGVTLVLGWSDPFGVFAAFDASRRTSELGRSPSIQIAEATLLRAQDTGGAVQDKGDGEFAVAVRPDRLAAYVDHQSKAHSGDVSSLIRAPEYGRKTDSPEDLLLENAVEGSQEPRLGGVEERAQRHSVLERLDALERELEIIRSAAPDRGHNHPPELLPVDDAPLSDQISAASSNIRTELDSPKPNASKIALGAQFLRWVSVSLRSVRAEAGKLGRKVTEKAREKVAELFVTTAAGGAMTYWETIADLAGRAAAEILKWLGLIF